MGIPQSKHSYKYKPKKKLRKKELHNSVFVDKPEHLMYDDLTNNPDTSRYNTTKSCIDIRLVKKKDRPLSLDEDLLERPASHVFHQFSQRVAGELSSIPLTQHAKKSQESSDGFKDVYDDDYYNQHDNQLDSGDFKDAVSYHSLEFESINAAAKSEKLNKSVEFEFERHSDSKRGSRRRSHRSIQLKEKQITADKQSSVSDVIDAIKDVPIVNELPIPSTSQKVDIAKLEISTRQISVESTEETVTPIEIITLEDVTTILQDIKDKILRSEINDTEVYHQLLMCKKKAQGIHVTSIKIRAKKTMLIGKINKFIHWFAIPNPELASRSNSVEESLTMPKKGLEETEKNIVDPIETTSEDKKEEFASSEIDSLKTEINNKLEEVKYLEKLNLGEVKPENTLEFKNVDREDINSYSSEMKENNKYLDHLDVDVDHLQQPNLENTIPEKALIYSNEDQEKLHSYTSKQRKSNQSENVDHFQKSTVQNTKPDSTSVHSYEENEDNRTSFTSKTMDFSYDKSKDLDKSLSRSDNSEICENSEVLGDYENEEINDSIYHLVENNIEVPGATAEENSEVTVYDQINNIRVLLQEVHYKMDSFTGRRYDLQYHNIIDEVFQARILLNNVKATKLLETAIMEDYEKFFEDLLLYFEDLVDQKEKMFENVAGHSLAINSRDYMQQHHDNHEDAVDRKEDATSFVDADLHNLALQDSEYYINMNGHQLKSVSFDTGSESSTNHDTASDEGEEENTHFMSLTEYDGKVIETCETFNKNVFLKQEADLSPDDDFIYQTNAAGQIVFDHEASQKPYIVDPISFSKCRMRPLSIIHEQFDEFHDCTVEVGKKHIVETILASEDDRDDWDSFDENMAKNVSLEINNEQDSEVEEFEQMERDITSDISESNNIPFVEIDNNVTDILETGDDNTLKLEMFSNTSGTYNDVVKDGNSDNYDSIPFTEDDISKSKQTNALENNHYAHEEQMYSDIDSDSLENMADTNENITSQNNTEETEANIDFQPDSITEGEVIDATDTTEDVVHNNDGNDASDRDTILNFNNYNFNSEELVSYNEILKVNAIIDTLQTQINHFSGEKTSPEYMTTFKQIIDNMRLLNTIDNCDYQEDILNLIDYTSDKIQKCLFELDLKVS